MLSNNPETVDSSTALPGVLWHHGTDPNGFPGDEPLWFRVVVWHVNQRGDTRRIGLTLENLSSTNTLQITTSGDNRSRLCEHVESDSSQWITRGKQLAQADLDDTLGDFTPLNSTFGPGQRKAIWVTDFPASSLYGAHFALRITRSSGTGNILCKLRTVMCLPSQNVVDYAAAPVAKQACNGYRGGWNNSRVRVLSDTYTITGSKPNSKEIRLTKANGEDVVFLKSNSYDSNNATDAGNAGNYGVREDVVLAINNTTLRQQTVGVWVRAAGTGQNYAGAAKYLIDGVLQLRGIPAIKDGTATNAVKIANIGVHAGQDEYDVGSIMHADGAALPVTVLMETV